MELGHVRLHVSIRAPARGATRRRGLRRSSDARFDPRSRAGSDLARWLNPSAWHVFRSALPRGERLCGYRCRAFSRSVSIRAPARGATVRSALPWTVVEFRSALPRGERPAQRDHPDCGRFDPRSRAGSDSRRGSRRACVLVSIRAPARGATKQCFRSNDEQLFRSALPRGERHLPQRYEAGDRGGFDPRSRAGSDNSTPHERA